MQYNPGIQKKNTYRNTISIRIIFCFLITPQKTAEVPCEPQPKHPSTDSRKFASIFTPSQQPVLNDRSSRSKDYLKKGRNVIFLLLLEDLSIIGTRVEHCYFVSSNGIT